MLRGLPPYRWGKVPLPQTRRDGRNLRIIAFFLRKVAFSYSLRAVPSIKELSVGLKPDWLSTILHEWLLPPALIGRRIKHASV
jgi:hypothetical protein